MEQHTYAAIPGKKSDLEFLIDSSEVMPKKFINDMVADCPRSCRDVRGLLKHFKICYGLRQIDIAKYLGISEFTLCGWKNDKNRSKGSQIPYYTLLGFKYFLMQTRYRYREILQEEYRIFSEDTDESLSKTD